MSDSQLPRSPFAGMADFSARPPVRMLSRDEIEQMLAAHRLYLETEYHQGHPANFASADLSGQDFSGLNLRGIKMDRAVLRGADFTGAPPGFDFGNSPPELGPLRPASMWRSVTR